MNTDPISDFLTRIRNANSAGHKTVVIPASNVEKEITKTVDVKACCGCGIILYVSCDVTS